MDGWRIWDQPSAASGEQHGVNTATLSRGVWADGNREHRPIWAGDALGPGSRSNHNLPPARRRAALLADCVDHRSRPRVRAVACGHRAHTSTRAVLRRAAAPAADTGRGAVRRPRGLVVDAASHGQTCDGPQAPLRRLTLLELFGQVSSILAMIAIDGYSFFKTE